MNKIHLMILILFSSCGTVHLHHFGNKIIVGNKKLTEPVEVYYVHKKNLITPEKNPYFCNVSDVRKAFANSENYLKEKSLKRNIILSDHPLLTYTLELVEQKYEETVTKVEVFDNEKNSIGYYDEYHVKFYVYGILSINNKKQRVSATYKFTSSPRQSFWFKSEIINKPSFVNEKRVVENLMNKFSNKLYQYINSAEGNS